MKRVDEPEAVAVVLARRRGAYAQVWLFHVTHGRLAIRLPRRNEAEVAYIVAVTSEHITGPFFREDAKVEVVRDPSVDPELPACRVVDRTAAFELLRYGATVCVGPAGALDHSFENFLGEAGGGPQTASP